VGVLMRFNKTFTGSKIPKLTKWIYAISGIGRDAVNTLISLFYLLYIQYAGVLDSAPAVYAAQLGIITIMMILARLWDGINDPLIGAIIENTHWRIGKYKPWILIGAIVTSLAIIILFLFRPAGWWFVISFIFVYLLWEIAFTMNDIAYWSMLPSLTSEPKQRNEMTSLLTMFSALGAFVVIGIIPLSVAGNAADQYGLIATIIALVFLLSQTLLFIFGKERSRDIDQEKKQQHVTFLEMYRIFLKNKPLFWITWVVFMYYLGASIINNFGLTYFYVSLGYDAGGFLLPFFALVFAFSTIASQLLYPWLSKWISRQKLVKYAFISLFIGYVLFFFVGRIGYRTIIPIQIGYLIPIGLLIFSGQSIFYVSIMVMMTNTIEYNEWQTGERKESVIYSLRPLTAKFAASIQSGVVYVFLIFAGLLSITNQISSLENLKNTGEMSAEEVLIAANLVIQNFQLSNQWGLTIFKFGMVIIPIILFSVAYWIIRRKYTIDESFYQKMVVEIQHKQTAIKLKS
jgi:melibiose permease/lactose/raffinose/galactose permease